LAFRGGSLLQGLWGVIPSKLEWTAQHIAEGVFESLQAQSAHIRPPHHTSTQACMPKLPYLPSDILKTRGLAVLMALLLLLTSKPDDC
jgi:hypothetical protein